MKNLVKTIAIVALTLGTITLANAQKIAHISLDSLITTMPESKTAQEVAQKYLKDLENQVATMDTELQTKYADYMKNKEKTYQIRYNTKSTSDKDSWRLICGDEEILVSNIFIKSKVITTKDFIEEIGWKYHDYLSCNCGG